MLKPKNKIVDYDGNGLRFEQNGGDRPRVQDVEDGEFHIYGLKNGTVNIHKEDVDDLILLLQEVKAHGYKIDY
ncbi:hypothetical protein [Bacillus mycoides]|uniref:hypothetical protein n=1 Tax=Bacillus mycoides TaxID=1405 RepID=UPI003A81217D